MSNEDSDVQYPGLQDITVNEKDKKFLQAVYDLDGTARTTEIRERTGLESGDTKYRFDKFSKNGVIEIEREDEDEAKFYNPQKIAILTDKGEQFIRQGFAGGEIFDEERKKKIELTLSDYEDLVDDIDELESRINVLQNRLSGQDSEEKSLDEDEVKKVLMDMDITGGGDGPSSFELNTRLQSLERVTTKLMDRLEELESQAVERSKMKEEVSEEVGRQLGENDHPAVKSFEKRKSTEGDSDIESQSIGDLKNRVSEIEKDINYFYEWVQKTETFLLALKLLYDDQDIDLSEYIQEARERTGSSD